MGPKKRKAVARSNTPSQVAPSKSTTSAITDAVGGAPNSEGLHPNPIEKSQETDSRSYAALKIECKNALTTFKRGNHYRALKVMKDLFANNENSLHLAFIHRIQGTMWRETALVTDDADKKHQHLRNAIESVGKAVKLSPNSLEFFHFYANLLLETAKDPAEFAEVVAVCETALAIKNPVDPATEDFPDESPNKLSTSKERVSDMHLQLKSLIEKAQSAAVSYKVEQLYGVRPRHDRLKSHHPEAAAQLEQQKSASQVVEKRKSRDIKKTGSSDKKRELVKSYWNSMTVDAKNELMRIRVSDLKKHCSSFMDRSLSEMLDEALEFGGKNNVWKFWSSSRNAEKFFDCGRFVDKESAGIIEMKTFIPEVLDKEFANKLLNGSWEPLELNAAVAMLEQSKVRAHDPNEKWPTSEDRDRAKLLKTIHAKFQELIQKNCLAASHVRKVMHLALKHLESQSELLAIVEETPLCICFLGVPELKEIVLFLLRISQSCGAVKYFDSRYANALTWGLEIDEKIIFGHDGSYLMVDESSLPYNLSRVPSFEYDMDLDSDGLLTWILEGGFDSDLFKSWKGANTTRSQLVAEARDSISNISRQLRELIEEKRNHTSSEKALENVEALCSKVSVEVSQVDAKLTQLAAELRNSQYLLALGCCQDYRSIIIPIVKSFIREYLENVAEKRATEISKAAQESMLAESTLKHAKDEKESMAKMKDKADEKCDADVGSDDLKHGKRGYKHMKKTMAMKRRNKGAKADTHDELHDQTANEISSSMSHVEESPGPEDSIHSTDDATPFQEEEHKREIKLGAEEGKSEETLECQLQIDDDAQKHLHKEADTHDELHDQTANEISPSMSHVEESPGPEDSIHSTDDATPFQEEEHKREIKLGAEEGKSEETLECQLQIDDDAQKHLHKEADTHDELHDQTANEISPSRSHVEESPGPEDSIHSTDDATPFQEEQHKREVKHGAEEGKSEETLEFQRQIDDDAQKKHLHKESLMEKDREINASVDELKKSTRGDRGETNGDDVAVGKCETSLGNDDVAVRKAVLNAVVQSLWHIRRFREEFMWRSATPGLNHSDSPVACALYEMFEDLIVASKDSKHKQEAVSPTLRAAWDDLCPRRDFYHALLTNDACEAFCFILRSLDGPINELQGIASSMEGTCCTGASCVAYSMFGMEILEKISCNSCSRELQQLDSTSFFFPVIVDASVLREEKNSNPQHNFDFHMEKLNQRGPHCACPCGSSNFGVNKTLSASPHVFTAVMRWENAVESAEDIKATLQALSSEIHLSKFYDGVDQEATHRLVSVVCRHLHHYKCFAYSHDHSKWITYDDDLNVKVIRFWNDVIDVCERELLQPQYLMFESVNPPPPPSPLQRNAD